ncbi:carboxylating nicotinate-nucleotide diphosphorylase [Thermochromatium tepidum]|jgi:nicotinate-nucleotide pyrophosphorylase [carboxylating] (EC 2.4.2.19)|uniref:Probable nicotinate-nucleotide pyrophosphorylase [carboxylating] n=1 Tax=Thermochromatium tepidum ATCC 43061 TaxID=316276 RepID=A0A6I6E5Q1_THETI|nr:carboxylating nicotinate-nucleotide diphosphorylase [Thermochromatium tepidum]QGU31798.1 carboxylating nicotinate-nucleotide diphosphorylase [Thermochromatium tepidum ATCC 43061]
MSHVISPSPDRFDPIRERPDPDRVEVQARAALDEDVGEGDLTAALLPQDCFAHAELITRESAILCGTPWFEAVFRVLDPRIRIQWDVKDGEQVAPGARLCQLEGPARALLTGERTALNYLQTLSGTATLTHRYVEAVAGLDVQILDTRKTIPGLRWPQKYAVRCGGGHNHRLGLFDAILIKENHILAAGSIPAALAAARTLYPGVPLEIEVESLDELRIALDAGAPRILLDNFGLAELRRAVAITARRAQLEASGGISLKTVRAVAETGVDQISVGALTKDVRAVDLSMRLV